MLVSSPFISSPSSLNQMTLLNVILPITLAIICGSIVGVERQWRHKRAGVTTNTLVALGACGFSMLSAHGFGPSTNPGQLASAVITGIGFIGAGVIIHRGANVQGVNTAATLWANASMGMAMGSGNYSVGVSIFVAILIVQFSTRQIAIAVTRLAGPEKVAQMFNIKVVCDPASIAAVETTWNAFASPLSLVPSKRTTTPGSWSIAFIAKPETMRSVPALESSLMALAGVTQVSSSREDVDEGDPF